MCFEDPAMVFVIWIITTSGAIFYVLGFHVTNLLELFVQCMVVGGNLNQLPSTSLRSFLAFSTNSEIVLEVAPHPQSPKIFFNIVGDVSEQRSPYYNGHAAQ